MAEERLTPTRALVMVSETLPEEGTERRRIVRQRTPQTIMAERDAIQREFLLIFSAEMPSETDWESVKRGGVDLVEADAGRTCRRARRCAVRMRRGCRFRPSERGISGLWRRRRRRGRRSRRS